MKAQQRIACFVMVWSLMLLPAAAWAQTLGSGAIAGLVTDTTGGVLPGVTVEAASPALIEKVRIVVTDAQGRYQIVNLRPGVYTVTFTLSGFATVRREGLALTTGFTATVNAELRVGALEETITVSGESPVVDVQNVVEQRVFSREVLDALPVGKSTQAYAVLIPAASASLDVGGVNPGAGAFRVHGGTGDSRQLVAGMSIDSPQQQGGNGALTINRANIQEVSVEVGGMGAEAQTGGVQLHFVPKDGGNTFSGSFEADYSNGDVQNDNLTDALRARGLRVPNALKQAYDYNFGVGGPIKRDRLWFYSAHRWVGAETWAPVFFNAEPDDSWSYTPDLSRQGVNSRPYQNSTARLTWQATPKQKVTFSVENQAGNCNCGFGLTGSSRAPEAAADHKYGPQYLLLGTWTYPASSRLLVEATGAVFRLDQLATPTEGVTSDLIAVEDLETGFLYRARGPGLDEGISYYTKTHFNHFQRLVMSYVTGSHAFKTGVTVQENTSDHTHTQHGDATYRFRNGVPVEVALWATPWDHSERLLPILGIFAQDQWTLGKLTLNLGARFDYTAGYIPEQRLPAGTYVPARQYARVDDVLNWKDFNPRLGAAYDLFGTGRTALKVSLGRYVLGQGTSNLIASFNPANLISGDATRQWTDANGDFIPQERELGPRSNENFGQVVTDRRFADDVVRGWGNREYTWQGSASIQHELWPGTSLNVGYFRNWYGNIVAIDNQAAWAAADYDPYCITAPVDPRLPGGGGNQVCGLYDIKPEKFGAVDNLVTQASNYGKASDVFNGVDVTLSTRFAGGGMLSGGVATGASVTDFCALSADTTSLARGRAVVASSPNTRFCRVSPPWSAGTQVKFHGSYPLPGDVQVSATFQNVPGPQILANFQARNADARPSLRRNLASGRATIPLIEPGTLYEDRITQLDVRVAKMFRVERVRVQGAVEIHNAFNASSILSVNNTYGPRWRNVQSILGGRMFKFAAQVDF